MKYTKLIIIGLIPFIFTHTKIQGSAQPKSLREKAIECISGHDPAIMNLFSIVTSQPIEHYKEAKLGQPFNQVCIATVDTQAQQVTIHVDQTNDLVVPFDSFKFLKDKQKNDELLGLQVIKKPQPSVASSAAPVQARTSGLIAYAKSWFPWQIKTSASTNKK